MNRRMGFWKELALAQKVICRLWGTVAAVSGYLRQSPVPTR